MQNESKQDQPFLPGSDHLTAIYEANQNVVENKPSVLKRSRVHLSLLCFFGQAIIYGLRFNLSVGAEKTLMLVTEVSDGCW